MKREELVAILRNNTAVVTFEKVDGTIRKMLCTLKQETLPELKGSSRKRNDSVLPVWDLEKESWRSFRISSVISVEPV